jgi:hypothetical protein
LGAATGNGSGSATVGRLSSGRGGAITVERRSRSAFDRRGRLRRVFVVAAIPLLLTAGAHRARAETSSQAELLERLKRLEDNQTKLYELLKAKDNRLDEL